MSSHLVETSEEDSFTAVTRHIGDLLNEGQVIRALQPIIALRMSKKRCGISGLE